jgi:regulator of protease activity HflC (stomatin/prohibitin superfamily)
MKRINEAEGRAQEILRVAEATAEGIRKVAEALSAPGGKDAANLEVAKKYLDEFGKLAKENNTMIIPGNLADLSGMVASAMATFGLVVGGKAAAAPDEAAAAAPPR